MSPAVSPAVTPVSCSRCSCSERSTSVDPTGAALVVLGSLATALGGFGVAFRASGIGYFGQAIGVVAVGLTMLGFGLRIAAQHRRHEFTGSPWAVRTAPAPMFVSVHVPTVTPIVRDAVVPAFVPIAKPVAETYELVSDVSTPTRFPPRQRVAATHQPHRELSPTR